MLPFRINHIGKKLFGPSIFYQTHGKKMDERMKEEYPPLRNYPYNEKRTISRNKEIKNEYKKLSRR